MLVFWKENLVLLAVPKTGTTALEGALAPRAAMVLRDPPTLKHAPVYRYRKFLRPFFKQAGGQDPELCAVVRDPFEWLASWWRYRSRDDLAGHPNSTRDVSFDDFVSEYMRGKPAPFAAVGSQAKFLLTGDGDLGVDHLFRYEAMDRLLAFLADRLGPLPDLPRKNVSPPREARLSPDLAAQLRDRRPDEFRVWEMGQS